MNQTITKVVALAVLVGLFAGPALAQTTTMAPNELNLNNNPKQNPDTNIISDNQQQQQQQQQEVVTTRPGKGVVEDDGEFFQSRPVMPNIFINGPMAPFANPYEPFNPLQPSFGSMLNAHIRERMRQSLDQFRTLEQSGEGTETKYISNNGVTYIRTCTTKRA